MSLPIQNRLRVHKRPARAVGPEHAAPANTARLRDELPSPYGYKNSLLSCRLVYKVTAVEFAQQEKE
jgi:hypothetical protein